MGKLPFFFRFFREADFQERKNERGEEKGTVEICTALARFVVDLAQKREGQSVFPGQIFSQSGGQGVKEAVLVQQVEKGVGGARFEHPEELFENAGRGTFGDFLLAA